MTHATVYELSKKFGPPKIDLRKAEIIDSYEDESYATRPIDHRIPEDVSRGDFDFYQEVFYTMGFEDLLFYLYPIALEFERDTNLNCVDSYLHNLNKYFPDSFSQLSETDQESLVDGLRWLWEVAPPGNFDWVECPYLRWALGLPPTEDDWFYDPKRSPPPEPPIE
jgi:hypothetical protein